MGTSSPTERQQEHALPITPPQIAGVASVGQLGHVHQRARRAIDRHVHAQGRLSARPAGGGLRDPGIPVPGVQQMGSGDIPVHRSRQGLGWPVWRCAKPRWGLCVHRGVQGARRSPAPGHRARNTASLTAVGHLLEGEVGLMIAFRARRTVRRKARLRPCINTPLHPCS